MSDTFTFTGSEQTFSVPNTVNSVFLDAFGAQAGTYTFPNGTVNGANGGRAQGEYPTSGGETLYLYVGGEGATPAGGFNGGGDGGSGTDGDGGGGGGATDVRAGGNTQADRVLVAGGGGGPGDAGGGEGGGLQGEDGPDANAGNATGGGGGTQSAGGAAGSSTGATTQATAGQLFAGGTGASDTDPTPAVGGGGGGGGYYGGGGGGTGSFVSGQQNIYESAGGGGGSSFFAPALSDTSTTQGANSGNGSVEIIYAPAPTVAISDVRATEIDIDISGGEDAETYHVYRAQSSGSTTGDYTLIDSITVSGFGGTYTDSGLENGERYFYRVTSDAAQVAESDVSPERDAITDLPQTNFDSVTET